MAIVKKDISVKKGNPFQNAVKDCAEIADALKPGLSAMGGYSTLVKLGNTRLINGSVDIDNAVKELYPNDSRWDYIIGYNGNAYFIEIHPADTKNVNEMIKKVDWLKSWLESSATEIKALHKCGVFHWIPSGRVKILKTSMQYKRIAASKLLITNVLSLK